MADDAEITHERLEKLRARVIAQHGEVLLESRALLQELITLVRGLDPIRRRSLWPAELIQYIAQHQRWICPSCKKEIPTLMQRAHHVDHVVPWSLGGGNESANLQILHASCNLSKGNRCDPDELIRYLQGRLMNLPG